jgi:hypothetical protein
MVEKRKISTSSGVDGAKKGRFRRVKAKAEGSTSKGLKVEESTSKGLESAIEDQGKDSDLSELQERMRTEEEESKDAMKKAQLRLENADPPQNSVAPAIETPPVVDETKPSAGKVGMMARFSSRLKSKGAGKKEGRKLFGRKDSVRKEKREKKFTVESAAVAGKES